jgi:hypothetical protein
VISRRAFVLAGALGVFTSAIPTRAHKTNTAEKFNLDPIYEPQEVQFSSYPTGTIVVDPGNHFLYLSLEWAKLGAMASVLEKPD